MCNIFAYNFVKRTSLFFSFYLFFLSSIQGQNSNQINRVDPPNWWTDMQNPFLHLLINGKDITEFKDVKIKPDGIDIIAIEKESSKDYLFLKLKINGNAQSGQYTFTFKNGSKEINYNYEIQKRNINPNKIEGLNKTDLIYLIMPDRFANGNINNDIIPNFNEAKISRDSVLYRHGGDIEGIANQLNYIADLGATTLWLNPVQENNQPKESYHGYAITDHYKIDSRLGTNNDYKNLVQSCHQKKMKVVMDMVFNHTGNEHYLYKNKPDTNWFHQFDKYTRTNYRATSVMDPYASEYDKNLMQNGWFDKHMPDLNQQNKHVADYLIQNSIWWIETTRINGFRIDTWAYPDQDFMKKWTKDILNEYPNFTIFGEVWEHGPAIQAQFANNIYEGKNKGVMPGIIDFELYYAINDALSKDFGWTEGAAKIYYTLAQDFLYKDPSKNVIFLDNHDLSRFTSMIDGNIEKFKSGIVFLMTTRGIPSIFYGTEILMKAWSNPDAKVRVDFPGGWPNDSINKFNDAGRTTNENEAYNFIKKLASYRKNCKAITEGKLIQFVPENGIYVYFRLNENQKVMVIMNTTNKTADFETNRFKEILKDANTALNIIDGEKVSNLGKIKLMPNQTLVLEINQ
jgi:glycosidase